jgi:hypothetical protein
MKPNRKAITVAATALAMLIAAPSAHAYCSLGDNGITVNRGGYAAKFNRVRALQGMNCASARYVVNKWIRRSYRRSSRPRIRTRFYDGYVTWYCHRRSRKKWRCDEYNSNTAFTFYVRVLN